MKLRSLCCVLLSAGVLCCGSCAVAKDRHAEYDAHSERILEKIDELEKESEITNSYLREIMDNERKAARLIEKQQRENNRRAREHNKEVREMSPYRD